MKTSRLSVSTIYMYIYTYTSVTDPPYSRCTQRKRKRIISLQNSARALDSSSAASGTQYHSASTTISTITNLVALYHSMTPRRHSRSLSSRAPALPSSPTQSQVKPSQAKQDAADGPRETTRYFSGNTYFSFGSFSLGGCMGVLTDLTACTEVSDWRAARAWNSRNGGLCCKTASRTSLVTAARPHRPHRSRHWLRSNSLCRVVFVPEAARLLFPSSCTLQPFWPLRCAAP